MTRQSIGFVPSRIPTCELDFVIDPRLARKAEL